MTKISIIPAETTVIIKTIASNLGDDLLNVSFPTVSIVEMLRGVSIVGNSLKYETVLNIY